MANTNRITGKNLWVAWIDASGTVVLTGDQTAFSPDLNLDKIDVSAGADSIKSYAPGLSDFSATLEMMNTGTAGTAASYRIREGQTGTLLWAPIGTATGKPKWGMPALVTKYSETYPFNDAAKITVEFSGNGGALLFDGRTATW